MVGSLTLPFYHTLKIIRVVVYGRFSDAIVEGSFMDNKRLKNVDGFALRRRTVNQRPMGRLGVEKPAVPDRFMADGSSITTRRDVAAEAAGAPVLSAPDHSGLKRSEMDASMSAIDQSDQPSRKPRWKPTKKTVKRIVIALAIILLIVGGYLGVKFLIATGRVFNGNLFDLLSAGKELKTDEFGRTNILLFGDSSDSVAHQDEGAGTELTDSMMVISIDQKTKNAVLFSIPRDLWVKYGEACNSGYEGKINEVYMCGKDGGTEEDGAQKLMGIVSDVFDIEMQYYTKVSYNALKDAVGAVGGITVEIDSDDPRGVFDPNFDWQCNFRCNLVKYPNGPAQLDGERALALARARNAAGGYGLGGGNFDREQYQQKIILAIKEKAVNAGTLANPVAVSGLIDTLGNNVKTSFDTGEVKTLVSLAQEINDQSIKRLSLVKEEDPIMTTGNYEGISIVRPVEGLFDYSEVQRYIRSQLTNDVSANEDATIEVLNGSDTAGVAGKKAQELSTQGVIVNSTGDAPTSDSYGDIQWFDTTGGQKAQTATKLQEVLGEPSSGGELPEGVYSDADFVIIVGNGAN